MSDSRTCTPVELVASIIHETDVKIRTIGRVTHIQELQLVLQILVTRLDERYARAPEPGTRHVVESDHAD